MRQVSPHLINLKIKWPRCSSTWLHPLLAQAQGAGVLLKIVDLLAVDMLLHFGPANGLFLFEDMGAVALLKIFDLLAVDLLLCVRAGQRPLLCEPENKGAVEPRKYFGLVAMLNCHLNLSFSAVPNHAAPAQ
jgi:hypothetical protein